MGKEGARRGGRWTCAPRLISDDAIVAPTSILACCWSCPLLSWRMVASCLWRVLPLQGIEVGHARALQGGLHPQLRRVPRYVARHAPLRWASVMSCPPQTSCPPHASLHIQGLSSSVGDDFLFSLADGIFPLSSTICTESPQ